MKILKKETKSFLIEKALGQLLRPLQENELETAFKNMKDEDQEIAKLTIHAQSEILS